MKPTNVIISYEAEIFNVGKIFNSTANYKNIYRKPFENYYTCNFVDLKFRTV